MIAQPVAPTSGQPPTEVRHEKGGRGHKYPFAVSSIQKGRRAQIVLVSAAGERVGRIAPRVGFSVQAVRGVIHSFDRRGLDILTRGSHHPGVVVSAFDAQGAQALGALLH